MLHRNLTDKKEASLNYNINASNCKMEIEDFVVFWPLFSLFLNKNISLKV